MHDKSDNSGKLFTSNLNLSDDISQIELDNGLTWSLFKDKLLYGIKIDEEFHIHYGMDMVWFISMKSNRYVLENTVISKHKVMLQILPSKDLNSTIINCFSNDVNMHPMISPPPK